MVTSQERGGKRQVPLPLVVLVAIIAIALAGYMGYRSFGPPGPPPQTAEEKARAVTIEDMVLKTHGDMSKLSPDEVAQLNRITNNMAGLAFGGTVNRLKSEGRFK